MSIYSELRNTQLAQIPCRKEELLIICLGLLTGGTKGCLYGHFLLITPLMLSLPVKGIVSQNIIVSLLITCKSMCLVISSNK